MRKRLSYWLAGLGALLFAGSASAEATIVPPSLEQIQAYYPAKARNDKVEGSAVVECKILANTRLGSCQVIFQTPKGYGFGSATKDVVEAYGYADIRDGGKPGDKAMIEIRWTTSWSDR